MSWFVQVLETHLDKFSGHPTALVRAATPAELPHRCKIPNFYSSKIYRWKKRGMSAENQMNGKLSYTSPLILHKAFWLPYKFSLLLRFTQSLSLRLWPLTSRIHSKTLFIPALSWKVHLKPFVCFSTPEALALQGRRTPVRRGDWPGDKVHSTPNRTSFLLTPWSCSFSVCQTKQFHTMVLHPRLASSGKSMCPPIVWQSSWITDPAGKGHHVFSTSAQNGSCWDWMLGDKKHFYPLLPTTISSLTIHRCC